MPFHAYAGPVFRNFATSIESQELMDDLTSDPKSQEILKGLYYTEEEIAQSRSPVERVLEKSIRQIIQEEIDSKFSPSAWYQTRYSDGTWPVLYAAESEETATREALFHMMEFYREELKKADLPVDRRIVRLSLESDRCFDLIPEKDLNRDALISKDKSGYPYCQQLAKKLIREGTQMLRAPSARDQEGISIPIFKKEVIKKDEGHLKFLRCLLKRDETAEVVSIFESEKKIYFVFLMS